MSGPNIVVDTNVLIAALRSNRGSSNELQAGDGKFKICLSVALMLEYEDVCKRLAG